MWTFERWIRHGYQQSLNVEAAVFEAIFANIETKIVFRFGTLGAPTFEREFGGGDSTRDLVNLERLRAYMRPIVDGQKTGTFSAILLERSFQNEHAHALRTV